MKNLKSFYLLALAAALAFAGCKKDDGGNPLPGTLTIEKTEYALDAVENRTATVAFTAAAGWTLSVVYDDAESAADWLTVTPASGTAGEQTVELSATRNYRTSARTVYADLACGEQSVRLTVTQAAASDDTDFTTLFDPDFAKELQKQGIIADAENITPEDMEKIATMTELDVSGTYENPGTLTSLQGVADAGVLLLQSVDVAGYKREHGADDVVVLQQFVDVAGYKREHGADVVGLLLQFVDDAGCQCEHGADVVVLRKQSRRQRVEIPDHGLVRQRYETGQFGNLPGTVDVRRQDHHHRLPKGGVAPPCFLLGDAPKTVRSTPGRLSFADKAPPSW